MSEPYTISRRDASLAGLKEVATPPVDVVALDDIDLGLLRLLSRDSRTSQRQLARQLGVSAPTVGERVARLERAGVVRGYTVQLDWEALGYGVRVYLSVTAGDGFDVAAIMKSLWVIPEVEDVSIVTGSMDMVVRIRVRDHTHLRTLLLDHVWQIPGMQRTETHIAMAEMPAKDYASVLLDKMRDVVERGSGNGSRST
jgi:DNA-binding Lrp family transcriptional regulator